MKTKFRDQFTASWRRYFNDAELPITFEYTDDTRGATPEPPFAGHRCMVSQMIVPRNGRTLCFAPESVACRGGGRYLSFQEGMFPGFEEFIAHNAEGGGERYRRTAEDVRNFIAELPVLPVRGRHIIFKRWDKLEECDNPDGVIFFATPDVLAGLFTLVYYDTRRTDAVIAPFGAGCTSIIYHAYREQLQGSNRAIIGMFDPSARKCIKSDLITMAIPYAKFESMVSLMDESFLATHSWEIIRRRIK